MALSAESMAARIKAARGAASQTTDASSAAAAAEQLLLAMCRGIVEEIQANSELVPLTTDIGTAGAGIITGKVR